MKIPIIKLKSFSATLHLTASKLINLNITLILLYIVLIKFVVKDAYKIVKILFFRPYIRLYSSSKRIQ